MSESQSKSSDERQPTNAGTVYEKLAAKRELLEEIAEEDVPFAKDAREMLDLLEDLEGDA